MTKMYEATIVIRIAGIILSIFPLLLIFFKPFDFILNTLLVYSLLVLAALMIVSAQVLVLNIAPNEETKTKHERHEVIYDIITTSVVVILFAGIYVIPFIVKHS